MRDLANKMAELKFEAPLAQFEEISDEWGTTEYQSTTINNMQDLKNALNNNNINNNNNNNNNNNINNNNNNNNNDIDEKNENMLSKAIDAEILLKENLFNNNNIIMNGNGNNCELIKNQKGSLMINQQTNQTSTINNTQTMTINNNQTNGNILNNNNNNNNNENNVDNFTEAFTGSLEDLVNTFDEKITKCFGNYEQSVEELAPVQVRSQEEIMNECQMWWTITGNFGNILPIDWSKSYARQMHMPTLKLGQRRKRNNNGTDTTGTDDELNDLSSEDEAVAHDLDMHALILNGLHTDNEPIKTAEEVIKEIDDIMDETSPSDNVHMSEVMEKAKEVLGAPLYAEKLRTLTISELNELYVEMEILIREFSETLIAELALRDELEFEKELKNTFISLLLAVQNKRRQFHVDKKRGKSQSGFGAGGGGGSAGGTGGIGVVGGFGKTQTGADPKYLTTVIPYHMENGSPCNQALQVLIKILKAINDDSPTVPTLLTDYILKVLCPN